MDGWISFLMKHLQSQFFKYLKSHIFRWQTSSAAFVVLLCSTTLSYKLLPPSVNQCITTGNSFCSLHVHTCACTSLCVCKIQRKHGPTCIKPVVKNSTGYTSEKKQLKRILCRQWVRLLPWDKHSRHFDLSYYEKHRCQNVCGDKLLSVCLMLTACCLTLALG